MQLLINKNIAVDNGNCCTFDNYNCLQFRSENRSIAIGNEQSGGDEEIITYISLLDNINLCSYTENIYYTLYEWLYYKEYY